MNAIRLYQCKLCKLKRELLLEQDSPDLFNCIMTPGCAGKLSLLGQRKGTRPRRYDVSIYIDFEDRGFKQPIAPAEPEPVMLNVESGMGVLTMGLVHRQINAMNQAVFSVPTSTDGGVTSTQTVVEVAPGFTILPSFNVMLELIELEPLSKNERHYLFNSKVAIYFLSGEDNSALRRTLRVDPTDNVNIFIDGISLSKLEFDVEQDKIVFHQAIYASQLEVTVYKEPELTADNTLLLKFQSVLKTDPIRSTLAWGSHVNVLVPDIGANLICMYCLDLTAFNPIKTYLLKRAFVEGTTTELDLTKVMMLLALKPYAFEDRRVDTYLLADALKINKLVLQDDIDGYQVLKISANALTSTIIQCTGWDVIANVTDTNANATSVVTKALDKTIIGPQ